MKSTIGTPSLAAAVATWLATGLLAVLTLAGGIALFPLSALIADQYPEFEGLRIPLLALALAIGFCVEIILVSTAILVRHIRRDRIFNRAAARMVNVLIVSVIVATILTGSTLAFIPGPPLLAIVIMASVLVGIALFFVLLVLRSLLQRTVIMRAELDEVV